MKKSEAVLEGYGAKVIMTSNQHKNGTTRVAEAIQTSIVQVILVQGDEPLLLPRQLDTLDDTIRKDNQAVAWNATGPIENEKNLYGIRMSNVQ